MWFAQFISVRGLRLFCTNCCLWKAEICSKGLSAHRRAWVWTSFPAANTPDDCSAASTKTAHIRSWLDLYGSHNTTHHIKQTIKVGRISSASCKNCIQAVNIGFAKPHGEENYVILLSKWSWILMRASDVFYFWEFARGSGGASLR